MKDLTKTMNWNEYISYFENIIKGNIQKAPYDKESYQQIVKLNWSRQERWLKKATIKDNLVSVIKGIDRPQTWQLILEPWCEDAAHSAPIIYMLSELNPLITLTIQLRDSDSEIENYLTNGSKAIPKLIARDENNYDLFTWGPRPNGASEIMTFGKASEVPMNEIKMSIQRWYNQNKAEDIQNHLFDKLCPYTSDCRKLSA